MAGSMSYYYSSPTTTSVREYAWLGTNDNSGLRGLSSREVVGRMEEQEMDLISGWGLWQMRHCKVLILNLRIAVFICVLCCCSATVIYCRPLFCLQA